MAESMVMDESDESNNSSGMYNIEDCSILSVSAREMKIEELRLKEKHTREEKAFIKKLREEEINKEKKEKAIKSMNYLLNTSQKYSKFFLEKFKNFHVEDNK